MADIYDWSTTASSNTTVDGVNIAENCPASGLNNAIRAVMAAVRNSFATALETFFNGTAALPIANGGTAATSASAARTSLGAAASGANADITALSALSTPLTVAQGGTNAATAAAARTSLGVGYTGSAPIYYCRAFGQFSVSGGVVTVNGSGNVASVTRSSTGVFIVTLTTAMSDANYSALANYTTTNTGVGALNDGQASIYSIAAGTFRIIVTDGGGTAKDPLFCSFAVFG